MLFNEIKDSFSIQELLIYLEMESDKYSQDAFFNAILHYSDLIPINAELNNVLLDNSKNTWKQLAGAFATYISLNTHDYTDKEFYKNTVSNILKWKHESDTCAESDLLHLMTISYLSTKASYAVMLDIPFDKIDSYSSNDSQATTSYPKKTENYEFVYIAKQLNEKGLYKIGCTNDISKRIGTFKTGNCFVEIVASKQVQDKYYSEKWFHNFFKNRHYEREWYSLTNEDLEDLRNIFNFNFHLNYKTEVNK